VLAYDTHINTHTHTLAIMQSAMAAVVAVVAVVGCNTLLLLLLSVAAVVDLAVDLFI